MPRIHILLKPHIYPSNFQYAFLQNHNITTVGAIYNVILTQLFQIPQVILNSKPIPLDLSFSQLLCLSASFGTPTISSYFFAFLEISTLFI